MVKKKPKFGLDVNKEKENIELRQWIERNYGRRCPDYEKNCACCRAWDCYDYLSY